MRCDEMFIKKDESGCYRNEKFWEKDHNNKIIQLALMLNEFDPEIRHLDYLLSSCEEIFCTIRERVDEFDDGFVQDIEKCQELIKGVEDRIRIEIGIRIYGLYSNKFEEAMVEQNSENDKFHQEACEIADYAIQNHYYEVPEGYRSGEYCHEGCETAHYRFDIENYNHREPEKERLYGEVGHKDGKYYDRKTCTKANK